MNNKYITLFKELAQTTATTAETVMEFNRSNNDEEGVKTATMMRDDFQDLASKIDENYQFTKNDIAKLTVASMIVTNQIKDKIDALKSALTGYQTDLIPKLQEILEQAEDDKAVMKLAEEKFIINSNE